MKPYFIYALLISFLFSCKKDKEETSNLPSLNVSINGKAQKGPFKNGSDIEIYELNSSLVQTGISYSATVNDDAGDFSFKNINVSTPNALITATGYFYMEHFNVVSLNKIYLEAISDVQNKSTINVNILTHLIKPRIEKLVGDGHTFSSARTQAQNEFKSFFHAPSSDSTDFEDRDIANNGFLFAVSLIFQRKIVIYNTSYNYVYDLNGLINKFRADFTDNGQIDSQDIIDTLINNANKIELIDARMNLEAYITSHGLQASLSGYEQYIYAFQNAYSSHIYANIVFPDSGIFDIGVNNPQKLRNILNDTSVNFQGSGQQCLMTSIVPFDSSLVIKFTRLSQDSTSYTLSVYSYGWFRTNFSNGFTVEAQRKNCPNALMVFLWGTAAVDSARVEYFMNNQPVPYFFKNNLLVIL